MVSQGLAELRLRNSSNLVMANTFTEVHRKDGLVCAVGDAAAVSVECAGVDGLEVWETLMDGEFATPVDGRVLSLGLARDASGLVLSRATERGAERDGNGILCLGIDHILCVRRLPPPGDTAYR